MGRVVFDQLHVLLKTQYVQCRLLQLLLKDKAAFENLKYVV